MDALGRLDQCLETLDLGPKPSMPSCQMAYKSKVDDMVTYYENFLFNAGELMNLAANDGFPVSPQQTSCSSAPLSPLSSPRCLPASRFPCYRWECSTSDNRVNRAAIRSLHLAKGKAYVEELSSPESTLLSNVSTFDSFGSSPYHEYPGHTPSNSAGSTWSDLSDGLFDPEDEDSGAYQVQRIAHAYRNQNHYYLPECREDSSFDSTTSTITNLNSSAFSESNYSFWGLDIPADEEFLGVEENCEASSSNGQVDISPSVLGRIFQFKLKNEVINIDFNEVTDGVVNSYSWRLDLYAPQFRNVLTSLTLRSLSKFLNQNITLNDVIEKPSGLRKRLANSIRSLKLKREQTRGTFQRNLKEIRNQSDVNSPFPIFLHCIMDMILNQASLAVNMGLFRTAALKTRVEEFRKICDNLGVNDLLPLSLADSNNLVILADIFKQFIREIPGQLISNQIWQLMMKCTKNRDSNGLNERQIEAIRACLALIDIDKRDALCIVMFFLQKLSKHAETTLMTIENLVSVFMPTICRLQNENNDTPDEYFMNCKSLATLLSLLISRAQDVFRLPKVVLDELESPIFSSNRRKTTSCPKYDRTRLPNPTNGIIPSYSLKTNREYRSDTVLEMNTVDLFRFLIENRSWDPTFKSYTYLKTVSDDIELIAARTKWCPSNADPIYLARMSTRHYAKVIQKHTFTLIERSAPLVVFQSNSPVVFNKLHFILRRIDSHKTNVTFVIGVTFRNPNMQVTCDDLIKHTCDVVECLKSRFHSDPIYC